jgi:hypothetical protein
MVYDIEKRVERRLSRRQAFMECPNCGHDCIPKGSPGPVLCFLPEICEIIE